MTAPRTSRGTDDDNPETGHCPQCGRYCADIHATINGLEYITKVEGVCSQHGMVDLTGQAWNYDDFVAEAMR